MGKFSLHVQHFKREQLHGLEMHHMRKGKTHSNKEINSELSSNNLILKQPQISLYQDVKSDIENKINGRVTKASVWISELVLTLPKDIPPRNARFYFNDCMEYLAEIFEPDCIKMAVVHMDETQPHLHALVEPRTKDNKLSRKSIFTRDFLRNLHENFAVYLCSRGWNVEHEKSEKTGDYRKSIKELKEETRKLEQLNEALRKENLTMIEANYQKIRKIYDRYHNLHKQLTR